MKQYQSISQASCEQLISDVLDRFYPELFDECKQLLILSNQIKIDFGADLLYSYINWIFNALDDLFRKEKVLLFPRILSHSHSEKSQSLNPNAIQWLYQAHIDLIRHINKLKHYVVSQIVVFENNEIMDGFYLKVNTLEKQCLQLKIVVEDYILSPLEKND